MTVKYHYEQPAYLGLYKKQLPFTLLHRKGLTCFPLLTNYIEVLTNYIGVHKLHRSVNKLHRSVNKLHRSVNKLYRKKSRIYEVYCRYTLVERGPSHGGGSLWCV